MVILWKVQIIRELLFDLFLLVYVTQQVSVVFTATLHKTGLLPFQHVASIQGGKHRMRLAEHVATHTTWRLWWRSVSNGGYRVGAQRGQLTWCIGEVEPADWGAWSPTGTNWGSDWLSLFQPVNPCQASKSCIKHTKANIILNPLTMPLAEDCSFTLIKLPWGTTCFLVFGSSY